MAGRKFGIFNTTSKLLGLMNCIRIVSYKSVQNVRAGWLHLASKAIKANNVGRLCAISLFTLLYAKLSENPRDLNNTSFPTVHKSNA